MRKAHLAWLAAVVPLWVVLILCTHWEPVMRDGWNHLAWHRTPTSPLQTFYAFTKSMYLRDNPRLGQLITYLLFAPGPGHSIVTPIVELSLFGLLSALVLGRWPSTRRADDALLFATIAAIALTAAPVVGPMLFYRPYTGNYLYGLVVNLAFLVPYRFAYEGSHQRRRRWVPLMFLLGIASGLCNEHTGPAVVALAAFATYAVWHRGERIGRWAIAGVAGMIVGGLLLYFAPGQALRYGGLASHASMVGRIAGRGVLGDARVVSTFLTYFIPVLAWIVLGLIARRSTPQPQAARPQMQTRSELALIGGALAIALTLLVSPKIGARLYFAPFAVAAAGIAGWVVAQLSGSRPRIAAWVLALGAIVWASINCVFVYHALAPQYAARLDALEHAPPNSVLDVQRYTVHRSRWNLPDDLDFQTVRNEVAGMFSLALVREVDAAGNPIAATPEHPGDP